MDRVSRIVRRPALGGFVLLIAVVLVACLSKPFQPTPTPIRQPSFEASGAPGVSGETTGLPVTPSELAALLPDKIGGLQAFRIGLDGEQLIRGGNLVNIKPGFQDVLDSLGAVPGDVLFALSSREDPDGSTVVIMAFRVRDAQTPQLESAFQAFWAPAATDGWQPGSVGGKSVAAATDPDNPGNTIFSYAIRDIIFFVSAPSEEHAATLLSPLP
jgi:hypothetical protein